MPFVVAFTILMIVAELETYFAGGTAPSVALYLTEIALAFLAIGIVLQIASFFLFRNRND